MRRDDVAYHRQRACENRHSRFSVGRRERKRIGVPHRVLGAKLAFDVVALQTFPVAMADFAQPVAGDRFEAAWPAMMRAVSSARESGLE